MTRLLQTILLFGIWLTTSAHADDPSSFYVERNIVERIFKDSTNQSKNTPSSTVFTPSFGFHMPGNLRVSNRYFETNYAKDVAGIPFFQGRISKSIWQVSPQLTLGGGLAAGYGYRQSTVSSSDPSGQTFHDNFDIQWTNVEVNTDLSFTTYSMVKPSIQLGLGNAWVHQVGSLDGVDQNVAIPYVSLGTALGVEASQKLSVQAAASYEVGLGAQKYRGWTLTLGTLVKL